MNEALLAYWRSKGIEKEKHVCRKDPNRTWVAYVPIHAVRHGFSCPVWFIDHAKGRDLLDIEAWGFVQMVAEKQIIVLTVEEGNDEAIVADTLLSAAAMYPVDLARVYLAGHSFSGSSAGRIAIAMPERFAGLCMMGSQYSGLDSTAQQIEKAKGLKMPRIDVHGTAEKILPFNITPSIPASPQIVSNVTPTDMGLLACYREQIFWRRLNDCDEFTLPNMERIQETSDDIVEQKIGTFLSHTELRDLGSVLHYIGDVRNRLGQTYIRHIGVEGAPHYPSAYAAELAWEFLHRFSRKPGTGQLVIGQ
jgi:pimeloyl-ACP methyl ester carboxylesterase